MPNYLTTGKEVHIKCGKFVWLRNSYYFCSHCGLYVSKEHVINKVGD